MKINEGRLGKCISHKVIYSGAGIKQVSEQTIDFGACDGPMTEKQLKAAKGEAIFHIPLTMARLQSVTMFRDRNARGAFKFKLSLRILKPTIRPKLSSDG